MQYPINGGNVFVCVFSGGGGGGGGGGRGYADKQPANIHLGVVILRKFCLRYESILDPPMQNTTWCQE